MTDALPFFYRNSLIFLSFQSFPVKGTIFKNHIAMPAVPLEERQIPDSDK